MTDDSPIRVIDGEIHSGFSRYYTRETENTAGAPTVRIVEQGRKHSFGRGYSDSGRPREPTIDLTRREARAVRDLLDDWLETTTSEADSE